MNHPTVVPALVAGELRLGFEDDDRQSGTGDQTPGGSNTDDATTDDGQVVVSIIHGGVIGPGIFVGSALGWS
jgi:hypothetical protein